MPELETTTETENGLGENMVLEPSTTTESDYMTFAKKVT